MTNRKNTKKALLGSVIALILCFSMLVGTTFAWFTDSVTSGSNKIQAGTLQIDLELLEKDGSWTSIKDSGKAIFDYDNWEPGYTDVKILKVVNEGTLALKWVAKFVSESTLTELADVIDVYVNTTVTAYPTDRADLENWTKVGTVAEFVNTISETTNGTLEAGESAYLGIALKMQESAGNKYQGMDLGGAFDIMILATQYTSESDSFDNQYDKDATYTAEINALRTLLANAKSGDTVEFALSHDAYVNSSITVPAGVTLKLNGNGHTIVADMDATVSNTVVFYAKNADIHLSDLTITGTAAYAVFTNGVSWEGGNTSASLTNVTVNMHASVPYYPVNFNGKGNITLTNCTITGEGSAQTDIRNGFHVWAGAEINLTVNGGNVGNVLMNANGGSNSTLTLNDGAVVNKLLLATDGAHTAELTNNDGTVNELIQQVDSEAKLRAAITSAQSGESVSIDLYKDVTITGSRLVVPTGVNLTIYGDGHTITTIGWCIQANGGELEFNDLTLTGPTTVLYCTGGNITMNNVTVNVTSTNNYGVNLYGGGIVELNNCTVTGMGAEMADIWFGDGRTVTINGGSYSSMLINCSTGAGSLSAGKLTVNGAVIDKVYVGASQAADGTITRAKVTNNNGTIGSIVYEDVLKGW